MTREQLINELILKHAWSRLAFDAWDRSRFCCVYCDDCLLASLDDYKRGVLDHLLPKTRYADLEYDPGNLVLSCVTCNLLKRAWVPKDVDLIYSPKGSLSDPQRELLLKRARKHVRTERTRKEQELNQMLQLLRNCPEVITCL